QRLHGAVEKVVVARLEGGAARCRGPRDRAIRRTTRTEPRTRNRRQLFTGWARPARRLGLRGTLHVDGHPAAPPIFPALRPPFPLIPGASARSRGAAPPTRAPPAR